MAIIKNAISFGSGFNITAASPIDSRVRVTRKSDLYSAWNSEAPVYAGMVVTVTEEDKVYVLKTQGYNEITGAPIAADHTLEDSWVAVGSGNGSIAVDSYTEATELATVKNIGQIIYVKLNTYEKDGEEGGVTTNVEEAKKDENDNPILLYAASPYIVVGEGSLMKLAASTAGNIDLAVAELQTKVADLEKEVDNNKDYLETLITQYSGDFNDYVNAHETEVEEMVEAITSGYTAADANLKQNLENAISSAKTEATDYAKSLVFDEEDKPRFDEVGAAAAAQAAAEATAAADATAKANAAQSAAEATAAADATAKANAAQSAAEATAAADATAKANAAQAAAEATAAADASSKANTAEANAKKYADSLVKDAEGESLFDAAGSAAAAQAAAATDATNKADAAEAAAKKYADDTFVVKVDGSRLMTNAEGAKLQGIEEGAQVNVIEKVFVNDEELVINEAEKSVNITIPSIPVKGVKEKDAQFLSLDKDGLLDTNLIIAYVPASKDENDEHVPAQLRLQVGEDGAVVSSINADKFVKDGMIEKVELSGPTGEETGKKYMVITWNTESGKDVMRLDVSDLFNPYSAGNGITINETEFSIKLKTDEAYIAVDATGLHTTEALWTKVTNLDNAVLTAATTYADSLVKDGQGNVRFDAAGSAAAAKAEAISTAAADATSKANAAQAAAEATAAADATSKADAAKAAAISTAAADATSKANAAQAAAEATAALLVYDEESNPRFDEKGAAAAAENAAKQYADELVKDGDGLSLFDAAGSAAAAENAAKKYADDLVKDADGNSRFDAAGSAEEAEKYAKSLVFDEEDKPRFDEVGAAAAAQAAAISSAKTYADETFVSKEGFNEYTEAMESKLDGIAAGAEVNVIETITVNGVEATIADGTKDAEVTITGEDIELGANITGEKESEILYASDSKLSVVLQGIQDSLRAAVAGGVNTVVSGDDIVEVDNTDTNNLKVSVKVEASSDETVAAGHIEVVKGENGLYAAMYFDGDDAEV